MKRLSALLLTLIMILALSACGADSDKSKDGTDKPTIGEESDEPTYTISAGGLELKHPENGRIRS